MKKIQLNILMVLTLFIVLLFLVGCNKSVDYSPKENYNIIIIGWDGVQRDHFFECYHKQLSECSDCYSERSRSVGFYKVLGWPASFYCFFSKILSFALRARGFSITSFSLGVIGFLFINIAFFSSLKNADTAELISSNETG